MLNDSRSSSTPAATWPLLLLGPLSIGFSCWVVVVVLSLVFFLKGDVGARCPAVISCFLKTQIKWSVFIDVYFTVVAMVCGELLVVVVTLPVPSYPCLFPSLPYV